MGFSQYKKIRTTKNQNDRCVQTLHRSFSQNIILQTRQLSFSGSVGNISSEFAVNCTDCVISGNVTAGDSVQCGDVGGSIGAGDGVKCGSVGGNVKAGDFVRCGDVSGSVTAGDYVQCGSIGGSVISSDGVRIKA